MAIDFGGALTSDNYSTGVLSKLNATDIALAQFLDPTYVTYTGTITTGSKRLTSTGVIEQYNGSAWVALSVGYVLKAGDTMTGNLSVPRIDQSNGSINFASLGNGSTSWQIGTQTAGKPLDIFTGGVVRAQFSDTGLAVTGVITASSDVEWSGAVTQTSGSVVPVSTVANTIGGSSKRTTFTQNTDGSYVIDNDAAGNGSAPRFVVKVGTVEKASISSTGLAVTGTLSATGTSSLARIDQSNGSINFSSFGNGSTSWQIGTVTAGKPLDIFTGGVVRAQFSDTGLAVTGALSATKRAYTSATAVSFSATPTFDASTTNIIVFGNLTANVTSMTMSNAQEGQFLSIRFRQDATGSRTVALPSGAKVSGAITATANLTSYLNITYNATDSRWEGNWSNIPA